MINIDASTVAVETSSELKSVLEGDNSITLWQASPTLSTSPIWLICSLYDS